MIINILLEQINEKIHFNSGGCCYVAYLIAKELERLNEPFLLTIQSSSYRGNHYCIACSKFGLLNPFSKFDNIVQFKASSDTIKKIYDENEWSQKYDTKNNDVLKCEIENLFSVY